MTTELQVFATVAQWQAAAVELNRVFDVPSVLKRVCAISALFPPHLETEMEVGSVKVF